MTICLPGESFVMSNVDVWRLMHFADFSVKSLDLHDSAGQYEQLLPLRWPSSERSPLPGLLRCCEPLALSGIQDPEAGAVPPLFQFTFH